MAVEQNTLPINDLVPPTTPVQHDRGCLIEVLGHETAFDGEVIIPINNYDNPMAPIERSTGIPLAIVTDLKNIDQNRHHGYYYKFLFKGGAQGLSALRASRLQRTGEEAHEVFHKRFDGFQLVESEEEMFTQIVLNCAGYIPPFGVHIKDKSINIIELSEKEKTSLRHPGVITTERGCHTEAKIGRFLMDHALSQNWGEACPLEREEFIELSTLPNPYKVAREKARLNEQLINIALREAVAPMAFKFTQARHEEALRLDASPTAWQLVKDWVSGHEYSYLDQVEASLTQDYAIAA